MAPRINKAKLGNFNSDMLSGVMTQSAKEADKAIFYSGCPDHHFIESIDDCGEFVRLHTGS